MNEMSESEHGDDLNMRAEDHSYESENARRLKPTQGLTINEPETENHLQETSHQRVISPVVLESTLSSYHRPI